MGLMMDRQTGRQGRKIQKAFGCPRLEPRLDRTSENCRHRHLGLITGYTDTITIITGRTRARRVNFCCIGLSLLSSRWVWLIRVRNVIFLDHRHVIKASAPIDKHNTHTGGAPWWTFRFFGLFPFRLSLPVPLSLSLSLSVCVRACLS